MPKKPKEKKQKSKAKVIKPKPEGYVFGRPTRFTEEIAEKICEIVSTHPIGYDKIYQMYPELPHRAVVSEWRLKHPNFRDRYLLAKAFQAEIMVEEIDDMLPHTIKTYFDERGNERIDAPSASLAIAKVNNRKWTAARLAPKNYGDQARIESLEIQNHELKAEMDRLRESLDAKHKKEY